jgi:hypothetical protein
MLAKALQTVASRIPYEIPLPCSNDAVFCKQFNSGKMETWCNVLKKPTPDTKLEYKTLYDINEKGKDSKVCIVDIQANPQIPNEKRMKWMHAAFVISEKKLEGNEFFHELAINFLLSKYCNDLPMFSHSQMVAASWHVPDPNCVNCEKRTTMRHCNSSPTSSEENTKRKKRKTDVKIKEGNRIWFRAVSNPSLSLEDAVHSVSPKQLASIIFQTLVGIRLAQHRIKLKHHDLHLGNVMLADTDLEDEEYDTPEGKMKIKLHGFRVVLIDYGLSSAVDPETGLWIKRLDECLLMAEQDQVEDQDVQENSWGVWGEPLLDDEGYDAAMLIESLTESLFEERPLDIKKLEIISVLQQYASSNFTDRGRPSEKTKLNWEKVFQYLKSIQ